MALSFTLGLIIFTNIIGVFPLLLYFAKKKTFAKEADYLLPMVWLAAIGCFYEIGITLLLGISPKYWFRFYTLLEFCVIFYFYSKLFAGKYKYLLRIFGISFLILFLVSLLFWNDSGINLAIDSYLSSFETIFVFLFSFLWFRELFSNLHIKSLWESPAFYTIAGLILYFSGTLFLFLLSDVIYKNEKIHFQEYWMLNVALTLVFRILLIISVWKGQTK